MRLLTRILGMIKSKKSTENSKNFGINSSTFSVTPEILENITRRAITEENAPTLVGLMHRESIFSIGEVYEYKTPIEHNDSIKITYSNNDIFIIYYILNNF
jgi:hypothetical protein